MRLLKTVIFAASVTCLAATPEPTNIESQKSQPATKLESFMAKNGSVFIKGLSLVGGLNDGLGSVSIYVHEIRDAANPKIPQYGVVIEVKEAGRIERENRSYIDEDEIDSLIRGIEYIRKIKPDVTSLENFEAWYRTKGDFSVTVFSSSIKNEIRMSVSSGKIGKTQAFLDLFSAERLGELLLKSKILMSSARQSLKQIP